MKSKKCSVLILPMSCQLVCHQVFEAYCLDYVKETLIILSVKTVVSSAISNGSVVIRKKTLAGRSVLCQERPSEN